MPRTLYDCKRAAAGQGLSAAALHLTPPVPASGIELRMTCDELVRTLRRLPVPELESIGEAALRVLECYRVLKKSETNVVAEILRGADEFAQWEHYPDDDVIDDANHSQYFYHAHSPEDREDWHDEHGHFHTFLRRTGIPEGIAPVRVAECAEPKSEAQANCHLIAISMNMAGQPTRMFTVNRWVTCDTWYNADEAIALLPQFQIDQALPSWPVNVWITAMLQMFRPQAEGLLRERDATLSAWAARHPGENPYEAKDLEVLSATEISVEKQTLAVDAVLKARGHAGFVE